MMGEKARKELLVAGKKARKHGGPDPDIERRPRHKDKDSEEAWSNLGFYL